MKNRFNFTAALFIVIFALQSLTAQIQDITFISLGYVSAVKPLNASVNITIQPNSDNTYKLKVKSVSLQKVEAGKSIDRELIITATQYSELIKAVQIIQQAEVINGPSEILDGESCTISYGTPNSTISYQVSNPTVKTDKRELGNFLKAYKLILRAANLDPNLIFG